MWKWNKVLQLLSSDAKCPCGYQDQHFGLEGYIIKNNNLTIWLLFISSLEFEQYPLTITIQDRHFLNHVIILILIAISNSLWNKWMPNHAEWRETKIQTGKSASYSY